MKKFLKATLQVAAFAVAASSSSSFAYRVPFYAEINPKFQLDGEKQFLELYTNWTFKLNDRYSIVPEIKNDLILNDSQNGARLDHSYFRILLVSSNVATVMGWNMGVDYRWNVPTSDKFQAQGSFGALGIRPNFTKVYGKLTLFVRDMVQVFLSKETSPLYVQRRAPNGALKPNPIISNSLEFFPKYQITESLVFAPQWGLNTTFNNGLLGGAHTWSNEFTQEYEIDYIHPVYTLGTSVGMSLENTVDMSPGADHTAFARNTTNLNFKINRAF